ncbi:Vacuolar protein sorting-associated protein 41-like protein [Senna tora]|uniref:Vacuolar protein sorting-associated protein 41-like protein n=1 Tax=Senna tora TaxID=362788 RepID=A0A834SK11_9FABA|nr:Vacuolar protein sorting-associated protein 41-like protein [Senna tora]
MLHVGHWQYHKPSPLHHLPKQQDFLSTSQHVLDLHQTASNIFTFKVKAQVIDNGSMSNKFFHL